MFMKTKLIVAGALTALAVATFASSASAESRWEYRHPRRDEVVDRLQNQNRRISEERRDGELSFAQAQRLRAADRTIFHQEQFDARLNGGHITRREERRLNREENRVSWRIGR